MELETFMCIVILLFHFSEEIWSSVWLCTNWSEKKITFYGTFETILREYLDSEFLKQKSGLKISNRFCILFYKFFSSSESPNWTKEHN